MTFMKQLWQLEIIHNLVKRMKFLYFNYMPIAKSSYIECIEYTEARVNMHWQVNSNGCKH